MTALYAGLLCTSMMLSACACLYSCISAVVHKLLKAQILHGAMLLASFIPLSMLLAQLPACENISSQPWTGIAVLLMVASAGALLGQIGWVKRHLSQVSIKTSCDHLPSALCFALENGPGNDQQKAERSTYSTDEQRPVVAQRHHSHAEK